MKSKKNNKKDPLLELEIVVQGDASVATTLLENHDVAISRAKPTRFVAEAGAIIGLAAGAVKLVSALIELAQKLKKDPQAPKVTARNLAGAQILLNDADEKKISSFLAKS